jgi:ribosomal protein S18 acetylase RimI-like enzyme
VVNTQTSNEGALALYERLGFTRQPGGLAVLAATP